MGNCPPPKKFCVCTKRQSQGHSGVCASATTGRHQPHVHVLSGKVVSALKGRSASAPHVCAVNYIDSAWGWVVQLLQVSSSSPVLSHQESESQAFWVEWHEQHSYCVSAVNPLMCCEMCGTYATVVCQQERDPIQDSLDPVARILESQCP